MKKCAFRRWAYTATTFLIIFFCAQTNRSQAVSDLLPANIDEDFELNITVKHILETVFVRSLQAEINSGNFRLEVGVGASAERIDVTLRGVTGHVRFRSSLETLRPQIQRMRNELLNR